MASSSSSSSLTSLSALRLRPLDAGFAVVRVLGTLMVPDADLVVVVGEASVLLTLRLMFWYF